MVEGLLQTFTANAVNRDHLISLKVSQTGSRFALAPLGYAMAPLGYAIAQYSFASRALCL